MPAWFGCGDGAWRVQFRWSASALSAPRGVSVGGIRILQCEREDAASQMSGFHSRETLGERRHRGRAPTRRRDRREPS
jgi:hypothetical protein